MTRLPLALLAGALVVCAAPPVLAQGKKPPAKTDPRLAEAKKLFDEGAAAYAQGNYEEAVRAWQKSYEISQKPLIFESIANAYERLGDARKARDSLTKWRDAAPPEERDLLDARIRNLEARVQREEEAVKKAAEDKAKREAQEKVEAETKRSKAWLPGAVLTGVGGAAVIVGVVLDIVAKTKRPGADACVAVGDNTFCKASAADAIKSSNTLAGVGDALWIGGAAIAATGAVLLFVLRPSAPGAPKDTPPPTAWIAPAPGGIMLGGTF